jgi:hypothetical protein
MSFKSWWEDKSVAPEQQPELTRLQEATEALATAIARRDALTIKVLRPVVELAMARATDACLVATGRSHPADPTLSAEATQAVQRAADLLQAAAGMQP